MKRACLGDTSLITSETSPPQMPICLFIRQERIFAVRRQVNKETMEIMEQSFYRAHSTPKPSPGFVHDHIMQQTFSQARLSLLKLRVADPIETQAASVPIESIRNSCRVQQQAGIMAQRSGLEWTSHMIILRCCKREQARNRSKPEGVVEEEQPIYRAVAQKQAVHQQTMALRKLEKKYPTLLDTTTAKRDFVTIWGALSSNRGVFLG